MRVSYPILLALALATVPSLLAVAALAHTGGPYDLSWSTVDGGGATFTTGGGYSLGGTLGQPDAGLLEGGEYTLAGGFWSGPAAGYRVHLPLVLRD